MLFQRLTVLGLGTKGSEERLARGTRDVRSVETLD